MTIECEHRTRPPSETLATREDEIAREQAEADFDAGEIGDLFAHLPDDWAERLLAETVTSRRSAYVLMELLASADDERLWEDFREARRAVIAEQTGRQRS